MEPIQSIDGFLITDEMLNRLENTYSGSEWPDGETNLGPVIEGGPRTLSDVKTATVSVKIPQGMKTALEKQARTHGQTLSELIRASLTHTLTQG
ncbi:ribbon-helix-helix protein, CopG family [Arcanobacterium canis]